MTVEDITTTNHKELSQEIDDMIQRYTNLSIDHKKLGNERDKLAAEIYLKAKEQGATTEQIRDRIVEYYKARGLKDRMIRLLLPSELKNPNMIRDQSGKQQQPRQEQTIEYVPKPIEQPTPQEQEYIDSVGSTAETAKPKTLPKIQSWTPQDRVVAQERQQQQQVYEISRQDKRLLNIAKYIQSQGFIFTSDPDIWKNDTGKGFAEELMKPENIDKRFIMLVQEVSD